MDNQTANVDYIACGALLVSILALAYTAWRDRLTDKRLKKVEQEQEREKQENVIRRSKASAPYFSPSPKLHGGIYEINEKKETVVWQWMSGNVLTAQRPEIGGEAPEGTPIIFPLDTGGKSARRIKISGDIPNIEIKQEPDIKGAHGLVFLKYPYLHSQHGKSQKVIFSLETEDGYDLTHTYETRHGFFEFNRIDPK